MVSILESELVETASKPFRSTAERLTVLFPSLEWDLKKAGYIIDTIQFLSVVLYLTTLVFVTSVLFTTLPIIMLEGFTRTLYFLVIFCAGVSALTFFYLIITPHARMQRRARLIDKDLEYMLKDIEIQLSAGIPLFDTFVNVSRGQYGECSAIANGIVQEVESGKSITDVLNDVGMWSPSEYLRGVLWQIVNAVKTGSNVSEVLGALSEDIRIDKKSRIESYGHELNLWGLIYMMGAIIMPSMGVTLMIILSTFLGAKIINERLLWIILLALMIFQTLLITFIKGRRPEV